MVRSFRQCFIFMDSFNWFAPEREHLGLNYNKATITQWAKKNPMPPNSLFGSIEEAITDLLSTKGMITVDADEPQDFIHWYEQLIEMGCN